MTIDADTDEKLKWLELELKETAKRLAELDKFLRGEPDLHAEWAENKRLGICPNIPEPGRGVLATFETMLDRMNENANMLASKVASATQEHSLALGFVRKLEAFFGPLLQNKNPPLDGHQVADKAYVDDAVGRIARAIREEMTTAMDRSRLVNMLIGTLRPFRLQFQGLDDLASVANTLSWLNQREMEREEQEAARAAQPSRLRAAIYALTGRLAGS